MCCVLYKFVLITKQVHAGWKQSTTMDKSAKLIFQPMGPVRH